MSHAPRNCEHVFGAWSTAEAVNEAGERIMVFQRTCSQCPHVDVERGAIVEPPTFHYAKYLEAGSEPDD